MLNNNSFLNIIRFVLLVLVQTLVFNRLNFLGYINPMIYILFLYWYPIKKDRFVFLLASFFLGITLDFFSDTIAIHTIATLTIAYLRPSMMRFCFGVNFKFQNFKSAHSSKTQQITFLALLIIVHHILFFSLEFFSFSYILIILKKVLIIGTSSFVFCILFISLFNVKEK